ncbi:hypothetical protein EMPS_00248 [Entomortierella parvispora]|uniref:Uncharacterized protein n=1 Tax=Entomortierella parvispora TaxID=205924 RepID=A0A9P3H0M2_9FUNG|nr:hypothetical protein EMPS_00248 [Entomortierella parvispora]
MAPKSKEHVVSDSESSGDEGTIKNLDYKPPRDFSLYKSKKHTASVFDTDEAAKHELWLIRVPEGVSNEDLATMTINLPPKSSSSLAQSSSKSSHDSSEAPVTLGTLKKKETSTSSSSSTTIKYHLQTVSADSGFAGEMLSLNALVPDSSKGGRLVQAPLGVHHHLALVAQASIPSGAPLAEEILSRPIPKREQPEGLKMRFKVSGFDTQVPGAKLSGSGKAFAAKWAVTLEKRRKEEEEALLRAQQEAEESDAENEEEEEAAAESAEEAMDTTPVSADSEAVEAEEEEPVQEAPAKKRKVDSADASAVEQKKSKKEKKEKKDKK